MPALAGRFTLDAFTTRRNRFLPLESESKHNTSSSLWGDVINHVTKKPPRISTLVGTMERGFDDGGGSVIWGKSKYPGSC
ncbi:hypothetical protein J6590_027083 [Homalodisca vitripennis]|nr:hypothetical protein J6590_027083 [Homalodisca vitripennis]